LKRAPTARPDVGPPLFTEDFTLNDIQAVRLLLRGGSVIDWHRLSLRDHAEVNRFLRVNEFDPNSNDDMARLEELRQDAVEYLSRTFRLPIPDEVADGVPARDLLLMASRRGPHHIIACVVLKVMHIVHHLAGRELAVRLPISDDAVFHSIELKVMQLIEEMRAVGHAIEEFEWSRKPRDSLITKLLAKRSTLAAKVYDKLRFRLIVPTHEDLLPTVVALTRQIIPFNYVIPDESVNHLVALERMLDSNPRLREIGSELPPDSAESRLARANPQAPVNEFSGPDYKIINFVADLPVRIEAILPTHSLPPEHGHVVFVLTEFQIADRSTVNLNESGESRHAAYKERQRRKVQARLFSDAHGDSGTPNPEVE
jgi:uncharacterized protein (TIGR04552 family)